MRRTRKRSRRRRRRQRGGFLDALKAGVANGLAAVGLKKKEEGSDAIQRTPSSADLSQPGPAQEGGRRRRTRRRKKRRKTRRRSSRRTRKHRRKKTKSKRRKVQKTGGAWCYWCKSARCHHLA